MPDTAPNADESDAKDFEALLRELQQVVEDLDGTQLSLEASINAYERAATLAATCQRMLDEAELRVSTIDAEIRRLAGEAAPQRSGSFSGADRARSLLLGDDDGDDLSDLLNSIE